MKKINFEEKLAEVIKQPIYRSIYLPYDCIEKLGTLDSLWKKHGIGVCWTYDQEHDPRWFDFQLVEQETIFIVFKAFIIDEITVDKPLSEFFMNDHNGKLEKEIRLLSDEIVLVEEVYIYRKGKVIKVISYQEYMSTGKVWFADKVGTKQEIENPFLELMLKT